MQNMEEHEIYERECGYACPCPEDECPHLLEDGETCDLEEPWFDCDDFIHERADDIQEAELRL